MKLDDLRIEELSAEQKELAECIGMEAYIKLIKTYGGENIYVRKADTIAREHQREKIINDFNGYNYKFLAHKYNLTERSIRRIVADRDEEMKNAPVEDQLDFFDGKL